MRWFLFIFITLVMQFTVLTSNSIFHTLSGLLNQLVPSIMSQSPYSAAKKQREQLKALQQKNNRLQQKNTLLAQHENKLRTQNQQLRRQQQNTHQKIQKKIDNISKRIRKISLSGMKRLPFESLPLAGIAISAGGLIYELKQNCENLKDLEQVLNVALPLPLNPEPEKTADQYDVNFMKEICLEVASTEDLKSLQEFIQKIPSHQ